MSTTKENADGAVGFGGTVQERQRLDRQAVLGTELDRRENSTLKGKGLFGAGILLGTAVLVAVLWICSSYNVSHDHVLSSPVSEGRLDMPSGR